jgi:hypothetical protein
VACAWYLNKYWIISLHLQQTLLQPDVVAILSSLVVYKYLFRFDPNYNNALLPTEADVCMRNVSSTLAFRKVLFKSQVHYPYERQGG